MPSDLIQSVDFKVVPNIKSYNNNTKSLLKSNLTRQQLIETVASILEEMIEERCGRYTDVSEIPNANAFHAKKLPSISLKDYLLRFGQYSNCHEDAFIYAMIYLDKIGENIEDFSLDSFNSHRLILLCMTTAIKFYDDYYYKNSYYSKIGGVVLEEFNRLEQEFLVNYLNFELYVNVETYADYQKDLTDYYQDKIQATTHDS